MHRRLVDWARCGFPGADQWSVAEARFIPNHPVIIRIKAALYLANRLDRLQPFKVAFPSAHSERHSKLFALVREMSFRLGGNVSAAARAVVNNRANADLLAYGEHGKVLNAKSLRVLFIQNGGRETPPETRYGGRLLSDLVEAARELAQANL
jgi:hypothetical protein